MTAGWNDEPSEPVKPLFPHNDPQSKIELFGWAPQAPTIVLSHDAYLDMLCIIQEAGADEIGWMGTVEKISDSKYRIEKIFILEQEVSGSHCEFDHAAFGKLCLKLTDNGRKDRELVEKMMFWGHLHPGDMTEPSGQDDDMLKEFRENDYFIRGIFTRGGKCVFTFVDYKKGFLVYDCPWEGELVDEERKKRISGEIEEKVSSFRRPHYFQSAGAYVLGQRVDIKDNETVVKEDSKENEETLPALSVTAPSAPAEEAKGEEEGADATNSASSKSSATGETPKKETGAKKPATPPPLPPMTDVEIQFDGE